ncbi:MULTISPECIES: type II toxin-antitoxin system VapC family toxin [Lyngbya]|jgi:predicted nucleic acid-binding protein|uniref:type II toxin-antitoxin system VapC family toxin n=1 Tax=Lyngbya TaxID=28073 RepID=UPI0000EACDD4|nr:MULTISPECIES: PIN domain-containing protein [Lyngbya]EAW35459.1 hypothetical protein L8106_10327 [Lyngbya sp. PCC 8106]
MKTIFADTFYWVASINPADNWHNRVLEITKTLQRANLVTTEEVLVEVLTFFSTYGYQMRQRIVKLVEGIIINPNVRVIQQTHESFMDGLNLYKNRPDKGYSLTDCISMQTMRQLDIIEVLTNDKHFTQEGFIILLQEE